MERRSIRSSPRCGTGTVLLHPDGSTPERITNSSGPLAAGGNGNQMRNCRNEGAERRAQGAERRAQGAGRRVLGSWRLSVSVNIFPAKIRVTKSTHFLLNYKLNLAAPSAFCLLP